MYGKFKTRLDAFWHSYVDPSNFFCFCLACLPTRQNGVENRDKAYLHVSFDVGNEISEFS